MLALAGCGGDDSAGGESANHFDCASADAEQLDGSLTIYAGQSEELMAPLIDCFEDASGVDVSTRYGGSPDMALQLETEGDATEADVFYSEAPGPLGVLESKGLLAKLPAPTLDRVDTAYRSDAGYWVGTSGRLRTFVYNTELVEQSELPATLDDTVGSRWKDKVGIAPSTAEFQDFVEALVVDRGEDGAKEFLDALARNDVATYPNNVTITEAVGRGEIEGGLVNHYYAERLLAADPDLPVANHFFQKGDVGSHVLVGGAAVTASAGDSQAQAEAFIDFLLTPPAQEYFRDVTKEYPIAAGVPPSKGLPKLSAVGVESTDEAALGEAHEIAGTLIEESGLSFQ